MKKRILWGVLLMLLGVGLILMTVLPDVSLFAGIPVWKLFLGACLLFWITDRLICGRRLYNRFDIFLPLGIGVLVFENEIGTALGLGEDFVSTWLVLTVVLLLTAATHLLFGGIEKKPFFSFAHTSNDKKTYVNHTAYGKNCDHACKFGDHTVYLDVSDQSAFRVSNVFGETTVFFQNIDKSTTCEPIELNVENSFGSLNVQVPQAWQIDCRVASNFGDLNVACHTESPTRTIIITGSNNFGETDIS